MKLIQRTAVLSALGFAAACSSDPTSDPQQDALVGVKSYVSSELAALSDASLALLAASPEGDADGWSASSDAQAVSAMKVQWGKARDSYERVEGAIAVLFPNLDVSTDERYDGFIAEAPDDN